MDIKEILRNNDGLIGDTTRVLTETYFNFYYNPSDLKNSCRALLEYRNGFYYSIPKVNHLTTNEISLITNSLYDNLPAIMLIFFYIECYIDENFQDIIDANIDLAYIVAIEEHKRICDIKGYSPLTSILNDEKANLLGQILDNRY